MIGVIIIGKTQKQKNTCYNTEKLFVKLINFYWHWFSLFLNISIYDIMIFQFFLGSDSVSNLKIVVLLCK